MKRQNTLLGNLQCTFGLHHYCKHPSTIVTHEGVACTKCGIPMEYNRGIRGFIPMSSIQFEHCLRGCGTYREV